MSQCQVCIELGDKKFYWNFMLCGIYFTAVLCHLGSVYQRQFQLFSWCTKNTKYRNTWSWGGPGHERISNAPLVLVIVDWMSLVWSGQSISMLSMSIFPVWMAGHDPLILVRRVPCLMAQRHWWKIQTQVPMLHFKEFHLLKIYEKIFRDFVFFFQHWHLWNDYCFT